MSTTVYANLLTKKAKEYCREEADSYFHHTFNPDWCYSCTDDAIWVSSPYGGSFSEEFQREHLEYVLKSLQEGVDYEIEVKKYEERN